MVMSRTTKGKGVREGLRGEVVSPFQGWSRVRCLVTQGAGPPQGFVVSPLQGWEMTQLT